MRLMSINGLVASCGVFLACSVTAQTEFPADVGHFIERRDKCDHFRGEKPYDQDRRAFLQKQLVEFCDGTDRDSRSSNRNTEATRRCKRSTLARLPYHSSAVTN